MGMSAPHAGHDSGDVSGDTDFDNRFASCARSGGAPGRVDRPMIFLTKGASFAVHIRES